MLGSTPAFPPFEQWQKMSEAEQDALIGRLEAAQRRQRGLLRLFLGLAAAIVTVGLGAALYLQLAN
jgi:hypothetical protein